MSSAESSAPTVSLNSENYSPDSKIIGSIDQGTSSTRFILVNAKSGRIVASSQMEHTQMYPQTGWHEHCPFEIWNNTKLCMQTCIEGAKETFPSIEVDAIGITNQRETTVVWNAETGKTYYNAIVWDDLRTSNLASGLEKSTTGITEKTGLPLASYFAGTKVKWLIENCPELREDIEKNPQQVRFGTIDTWLIYQLTGEASKDSGKSNQNGEFVTDVTNASRWLFMNLKTLKWDSDIISQILDIGNVEEFIENCLPGIKPSSHMYGKVSSAIPEFLGVKIASILGDQQAALFGQACFSIGEAKCTYGTGLFLMMNIGGSLKQSSHGLLTTLGYQLEGEEPVYALEGSVSHSGSVIQWLRDQLSLIENAAQSEEYARETSENEGLYFVPAFSGLFAPYWRSDARACIVGMTASHHRGHICRAALESTAYQAYDVFEAIQKDLKEEGIQLKELKVDGGATVNSLLMQFQADMIARNVIVPVVQETTALGACFAAGLCVGIYENTDEIKKLWASKKVYSKEMSDENREKMLNGWIKAVSKSFGWVDESQEV